MDHEALVLRLRALNEACLSLGAATDLGRLYELIIDAVWDLFDCHNCAVLLLDRQRLELTIAAARGYDPEVVRAFRAAPGEGVTGTALEDTRHKREGPPLVVVAPEPEKKS